jgi:rhodanese-related sulfurtransferase
VKAGKTVPHFLSYSGTSCAWPEYNRIRNKHRRNIMYQMIPVRHLDQFLDRGFPGTIIDLRSPEEYGRFHLKGAVNRELEALLNQPEELDRALPVLFYCARGSESLRAAVCFSRMGYCTFDVANGIQYYRGHNLEKQDFKPFEE